MTWAIEEKSYSQRRACALVGMHPRTYRYASRRPDDAEIRRRLRELAGERRRFGYRRLHILLRREGIELNHKKLFRLYREERLTVRRRGGRKRALGTRAPMTIPQGRNQRWSLDFVSDALIDSRALPRPGRGRRLHPRVPGAGRRHLALRPPRRARARAPGRAPRPAADDRQRQRHRADLARDPALAGGARRRMALHRAGQADAERLRREPHRPPARRMPQRAPVPQPPGGAPDHRSLEDRLQHRPAAHEPRAASPQPSLPTGPEWTTT